MRYQDLPFFEKLSPEYFVGLNQYDDYLERNKIQRSDEEKLFDKISLVIEMKSHYYTNSLLEGTEPFWLNDEQFKKISDTKWTESNKAYLCYKTYESRRQVNFDHLASNEYLPNKFTCENVKKTESWTYITSNEYFADKDPVKKRFILNAHINPELISDIDKFSKKNGYHFKVNPSLHQSYKRLDTVIIYSKNDVSQSQIDELIKIAKPHVRSYYTNDLDGDKLANGIFIGDEPNRNTLTKLYQETKKLGPDFEERFKIDAAAGTLSFGQFTAYQDIIETINIAKDKGYKIDRDTTKTNDNSILSDYAKKKSVSLQTAFNELNKYQKDFYKWKQGVDFISSYNKEKDVITNRLDRWQENIHEKEISYINNIDADEKTEKAVNNLGWVVEDINKNEKRLFNPLNKEGLGFRFNDKNEFSIETIEQAKEHNSMKKNNTSNSQQLIASEIAKYANLSIEDNKIKIAKKSGLSEKETENFQKAVNLFMKLRDSDSIVHAKLQEALKLQSLNQSKEKLEYSAIFKVIQDNFIIEFDGNGAMKKPDKLKPGLSEPDKRFAMAARDIVEQIAKEAKESTAVKHLYVKAYKKFEDACKNDAVADRGTLSKEHAPSNAKTSYAELEKTLNKPQQNKDQASKKKNENENKHFPPEAFGHGR